MTNKKKTVAKVAAAVLLPFPVLWAFGLLFYAEYWMASVFFPGTDDANLKSLAFIGLFLTAVSLISVFMTEEIEL